MTTTAFHFSAKWDARASASFISTTAPVSTPLVWISSPPRDRISDMFPRITDMDTWLMISAAIRFRKGVAPAPTGSKTTGIPFALALRPASIMDSTLLTFNVPIFSTRAEDMAAISPTSSMASDMTGDAPMARHALAQSFTVT